MKKTNLLLASLVLTMTSCDLPFDLPFLNESEKESLIESFEESQQASEKESSTEQSVDLSALFENPNEQINISFYTTLSATASYGLTFDAYLDKFMQKYPNITVSHTRVGGYDDVRNQIKTELAADQGPNLAYCYTDHVALYSKARQVQTLDKYINDTKKDSNGNLLIGLSEAQKSDFIESYYNEGAGFGDGLMYALPLYKSTEVLYYNEDVFEDLGLQVPTHWFKDDAGLEKERSMEYVCEKLKEYDPNCTPLGYDSESNWFITMCEQYGSDYTSSTGDHFIFNNKTNKDFVTRFKGWYDSGYVTTQQIYGSYTSGLFVNTATDGSTRSFMSIGSSAGATHQRPEMLESGEYPFQVGIAAIPQVNPTNGKVISQGPSVCIFKKDNKDEVLASWLLLKYLTTNVEFQATMSMQSGYVPAIKSVYSNEIYSEWLDCADGGDYIAARSAKICRQMTSMYFTSPAFIGSSDARDEVGKLISSVFLGTQTIDDAFANAVNTCIEANK